MRPDRQRVLIVTPYYTPHTGGVERYVECLTRELRRQTDWGVTIVTTGHRGRRSGMSHTVVDGVGLYRLPWSWRVSNTPLNPAWPALLREILRREQPTLVNAHAPVPGLADLAATLTRSCPFILTYHTGPMRKDTAGHDLLARGYQRLILPHTLRRAAAVITPSDYVRASLPTPLQAEAVTIHPGVDLDHFTPGPAQPADRTPRALFVGSLDKAARYKNLPGLLEALRLLHAGGHPVHLTVVGEGNARPDYEALAVTLGLRDHVTFRGALTGPALADAYREAAFLVLPTLFDSFATVLAEAMACQLPVVASATGGIPELVTDRETGLLVPPGDTQRLADAMRALIVDPALRRRLGATAHQTVLDRLDWRQQGHKTIDVFQAVSRRRAGLTEARAS